MWTLEQVKEFVNKFPGTKRLKIELNSLKDDLSSLSFKDLKHLDYVEVQLYNEGGMIRYLDIPQLKRLEFLNAKANAEDFQSFLDKHPLLESVLFDATSNTELLERVIKSCPNLIDLKSYGVPAADRERLMALRSNKLGDIEFWP